MNTVTKYRAIGASIFGASWLLAAERGPLAEVGMSVLIVWTVWRSCATRSEDVRRRMVYVAIIVLLGVGSTWSAYIDGMTVSLWQIGRSSIWIVVALVTMIMAPELVKTLAQNRVMVVLETVCVLSAISILLEWSTGAPVCPAVIRVPSEGDLLPRLYVAGVGASAPLAVVFMRRKLYLGWISAVLIASATQGKAVLLALAFGLIVEAIRERRLVSGSATLLILIFIVTTQVRLSEFRGIGDVQRTRQITEGWQSFTKSPLTILVGAGHGVPYSEGYGAYAGVGSESQALIENSRYDLENGPVFLLLRLGVLGTAIFVAALHPRKGAVAEKLIFWGIVLAYFTASAFIASPGGVVFVFAATLGLSSDAKTSRYQNHGLVDGPRQRWVDR